MTNSQETNPQTTNLGEDELIALCAAPLKTHQRVVLGSGDDCAVLLHPDQHSVVSVDVLVENSHFTRQWLTPRQIGQRAAQQNLADIAAMGAVQHSAVVGLVVPKDFDSQALQQLSAGLAHDLEAAGSALVGGDLTSGPLLVVSVTITGDLQGRKPLLRSGAKVGDKIIFAGQVGWSRLGLELFMRGLADGDLPRELRPAAQRAKAAYQVPSPPLHLAAVAGQHANSLMDLSDGMGRDGNKIARGSGVVLQLDPQAIARLAEPLTPLAKFLQLDPTQLVLSAGEDHGLFGTCHPAQAASLTEAGFQILGEVTPTRPGQNQLPGLMLAGRPVGNGGWDHFAS